MKIFIKISLAIVVLMVLQTTKVEAQSFSFHKDFVGEYEYQNVPDPTDYFTKYRLRYKFEKPFLIQLNTESTGYNDSFENRFDYSYVGIGFGAYVNLYKGLQADFGISFQKAYKREFTTNPRFPASNRGSKADMEKNRSVLFGNLAYEQKIYKRIGISLGLGIESILKPYPSDGNYGYNNQTNLVNETGHYASGVSLFYTISLGVIYNLNN